MSHWVSEWVTRSPIELSWTAKKPDDLFDDMMVRTCIAFKCMLRAFVYHSKNISLRQSCLDLCCGKRARLPPQTMSGGRVKTWEEATLWLKMWHLWKQCEVCEKFWGNLWTCGTSGLARPRMGESALTSFLLFTMKEVDKDDSFILHMTINHTIIL